MRRYCEANPATMHRRLLKWGANDHAAQLLDASENQGYLWHIIKKFTEAVIMRIRPISRSSSLEIHVLSLNFATLTLIATSAMLAVVQPRMLKAQEHSNSIQEFSPELIEFFEARVRPVLIEHCYECHNSHSTAEGNLALDYRGGVLEGGDLGPAVDLQNPGQSYLIRSLRHEISGWEMPYGKPKLPDAVVADLERWIAMGLPDPRTDPPTSQELEAEIGWPQVLQRRLQAWCYQPIVRPTVPHSDSVKVQPIDAFIGQQLAEQGLEPSPRAPASQLVRRLYFTLTGLPPTPEEARTWTQRLSVPVSEARDTAYVALVDELLSNPHFGERWARHWMDWLRYAESHGSEGDPLLENAWLYRDYLIRALNDDVPFDQLVREHVAGDLLEEPRLNRQLGIVESAIGTAQWRMVFHGFAPTDALDERVRFIDDQINVFSKAFMGLTVSCARCHDHKFDPIGQDDYYALFGVMASNRASRHAIDHWPNLPQQTATLESLRESIRRTLATEWLDKIDDLTSRMQTSVENLHGSESPAVALLARLHQAHVSGESIEAVWKAEETRWRKAVGASEDDKDSANETDLGWRWNLSQIEDYAQWFRTGSGLPEIPSLAGQFAISTDGDQAVVGIYPAGAYSHQLSDKLPARLTSPDIQLEDEYELWIEAIGSGDSSIRYVVQDYPRDGTVYPVVRLNDNQWRWHRFDISYWNGDQVHVELAHAKDAPLLVVPRDRSWFGVRQVRVVRQGTWQPHAQSESLGPLFELAAKEFSSDLPSVLSVFRQAVSQAVDAWLNDRINDWQALLLDEAIRNGWLENRLSQLTKTASLVNEYRTLEAAIPVATRVPGLSEAQIVDQPLYVRGDHRQPAEPIARRFPSFVPGEDYPSDVSGRRELAEDLLRADNPLTRRVIVNRLWHHVFGRGIVATPDNFGLLGSEPTHPDLLDWLADTFSQEHGWSLKSLIRELVLSETWQQDSRPSPLSQHSDPDNRHWSHTIAGRLEAEIIRDQLLAVAQTLDQSVFGPPQSNDKYRRSVYLPVVRNSLDPLLRVFDFPEPFSSVGKRDATNVPAQSLALLNNPLVVESSLAVSRHLANDGEPASDSEKIKRLFWLCFSREATDSEEQELLRFLAEAREVQATLVRSRHKLRTELAESQRKSEKLLAELRRRTGVASDSDSSPIGTLVAPPIVAWEFDQEIDTANSTNGLKLINGAQITQGRLIMRDGGYAISSPMEKEISEKTLEAWVVLDDLDQRGGGVVSLQTADGNVFDSIVFGEQTPGAWLAGSEFFNRSQQVAGPVETSCGDEPIHVAITYRADGEISVFRNGQLYGKSYRTSGLVKFPADSVVTLGLRHLPAGDNRGLTGQIVRARLYDFALSTEQIAASYQQAAAMVPLWKVIEKMTDEERQLWESEIALRERIHNELELLGQMALEPEVEVWQQLVHALFMMQEFIYVR